MTTGTPGDRMDDPIIDMKIAMDNVGNDRDLFLAVKDSALEEIPDLYRKLVVGLDAAQGEDCCRYAHTIKGAARVIAAIKTMNLAEEIELATSDGQLESAKEKLEALKNAIDQLIETLNQSCQ